MFPLSAKHVYQFLALFFLQFYLSQSSECPSFRSFFSVCKVRSLQFDSCLTDALNKARPCLQFGDPSLNIPILEPIKYAEHGDPISSVLSSGSLFNVKITLPNITEWGWQNSTYTKVKTDFTKRVMKIYQEVPYKHVLSGVVASGEVLGIPMDERRGNLVLDMFGVKQRYTLQMMPNNEIKVNLVVLSVKDVKVYLDGFTPDTFVEKVVNTAVRRFWRIGYNFVKMFAYVLSDNAKTVLATRLYNTVNLQNLVTF